MKLVGLDLISDASKVIRERLKELQDCQKSYVDKRWQCLEFEIGDGIFLGASSGKWVMHFGKKRKLAL